MATIFEGPRSATPRNSKKGVEGSGTAVISGISVPGSNESYERLFNPQWGTVRSKQGLVVSGGSCCGNPVQLVRPIERFQGKVRKLGYRLHFRTNTSGRENFWAGIK